MKKLLLALLIIPVCWAGAQTEIGPYFAPTDAPGTYLGGFEEWTLYDNIPDLSPDWTDEGDVSTNDIIADNGAVTPWGPGTYALSGAYTGQSVILVSPEIDFGTFTASPTIDFRWRSSNFGGIFGSGSLEVLYKESSGGAWNVVSTYTLTDDVWHTESVDLSGASSYSTYYLGFRFTGITTGASYDYNITAIDDIVLKGTDTCIPTSSSFSVTVCDSYTVPSGDETYTVAGTYNDTIPNAAGCDSVMTIDVTLGGVDTSVSASGITLTANATGATYQWIDCSDMSSISGATSQDFTPSADGSYAVIITDGSCVDTSACMTVSGVGIDENEKDGFSLYPNPANDQLFVRLSENQTAVTLELLSMDGKQVLQQKVANGSLITLGISDLKPGIYAVRITGLESTSTKLFTKQ